MGWGEKCAKVKANPLPPGLQILCVKRRRSFLFGLILSIHSRCDMSEHFISRVSQNIESFGYG